MLLLILGLLLFFAVHLVPTQVALRQGLVTRFGLSAYKAVFAAASFAGLALIVVGYHKLQVMPGKNPLLWEAPAWMRHVTFTLMLPVFILLVAAYVPSKIRDTLKHPMLAAVKLWALAHVLVNGDLGSVLLFGSFLAWAVFDRISVKRRQAPGPLGDAKPVGIINDVLVVAAGLGLYYAMLKWGHAYLIGVPVIGS